MTKLPRGTVNIPEDLGKTGKKLAAFLGNIIKVVLGFFFFKLLTHLIREFKF